MSDFDSRHHPVAQGLAVGSSTGRGLRRPRWARQSNARLARFAAFSDLATRSAPVVTAGIDTDGDGRRRPLINVGAGRCR
jgi:hypothetical protein